MRLDEGNPGELYASIEFLAAYAITDGLSEYTTIDNFEIGYSSRTFCLGGGVEGDSIDHITCQNSVAAWFGGQIHFFGESPMTTQYGYARIDGGAWLDDEAPYGVIHRLASTPQSHGVGKACIDWCFERIPNLRIDTHRDNRIMQHLMQKMGFSYCGIIYLANGDERLAFHRAAR